MVCNPVLVPASISCGTRPIVADVAWFAKRGVRVFKGPASVHFTKEIVAMGPVAIYWAILRIVVVVSGPVVPMNPVRLGSVLVFVLPLPRCVVASLVSILSLMQPIVASAPTNAQVDRPALGGFVSVLHPHSSVQASVSIWLLRGTTAVLVANRASEGSSAPAANVSHHAQQAPPRAAWAAASIPLPMPATVATVPIFVEAIRAANRASVFVLLTNKIAMACVSMSQQTPVTAVVVATHASKASDVPMDGVWSLAPRRRRLLALVLVWIFRPIANTVVLVVPDAPRGLSVPKAAVNAARDRPCVTSNVWICKAIACTVASAIKLAHLARSALLVPV